MKEAFGNVNTYTPGTLVSFRNRPWMVMPSDDPELILLKPLGSPEEEITGLFLPALSDKEPLTSYDFELPTVEDLGDFASATLLYEAARLSFRNAAGPFRSLAKLSFRPRAYQIVPLIMALKQEPVRLLIADDVGVGKTIEALLIAKELYERRLIRNMAVVCLPHLCEQWQQEMTEKFGMEAVVIRTSTVTALERSLRTDEVLFRAYPFQVISIDYVKSEQKRQIFLDHCPDLVIVDEAHTCARPAGANVSQQQRYHLLHDVAQKATQHLVLLTATPHSGRPEEFLSLLGLLKAEFEHTGLAQADESARRNLAKHYIQRRRGDVLKWMGEDTNFPTRTSEDITYEVGRQYLNLFNEVLEFGRSLVEEAGSNVRRRRFSYWEALMLLRGVMSSPETGAAMLWQKAQKKASRSMSEPSYNLDEWDEDLFKADLRDDGYEAIDDLAATPDLTESLPAAKSEAIEKQLQGLAQRLNKLRNPDGDAKAKTALHHLQIWLSRGLHPIVFCRFIKTAEYLGELCRRYISRKIFKDLHVEVITGTLSDEQRREKIERMASAPHRLLIATDCLSEGINLQHLFNAVMHYDLPWNPNRLEQREGRIDRFGQTASQVMVGLVYGTNNPIDGVVMDVLIRRAREIRRAIGISVPVPEDSNAILEVLAQAVLVRSSAFTRQSVRQLTLFEESGNDLADKPADMNFLTKALEEAERREKVTRSIFAHHSIRAQDIEADLREVDEAIGDAAAVEFFVTQALARLGVPLQKSRNGYHIHSHNLPDFLRSALPPGERVAITFQAPTPAGYVYIGRNHSFTERLCQYILNQSLRHNSTLAARASVIRTRHVTQKAVILLLRMRHVLTEYPSGQHIVAEEMGFWGYEGLLNDGKFLDRQHVLQLLREATPSQNMEKEEQHYWLQEELGWLSDKAMLRRLTDPVVLQHASRLAESHARFRKLANTPACKVVEPVLPADILGLYILLPHLS